MERIARFKILGLCSLLLLLACDDEDSAPAGEAQGPCYPNGTCNEGLVCASDLCVDLDGSGDTEQSESVSEADPDESDSDTAPVSDSCTEQLLECPGAEDVECLYTYIQCLEEEGVGGCSSFHNGCEFVGWAYAGCEVGSMVDAQYCSDDGTTGDPSTTTGNDTSTTSDTNDSGESECPTPGCSEYASKLAQCWPMLEVDWYAECTYVYDVCDAAGCLAGTAGQVACVNSRSCEEILDGVCNDGMQC